MGLPTGYASQEGNVPYAQTNTPNQLQHTGYVSVPQFAGFFVVDKGSIDDATKLRLESLDYVVIEKAAGRSVEVIFGPKQPNAQLPQIQQYPSLQQPPSPLPQPYQYSTDEAAQAR
jgi:hypothetical protein